MNKFTFAILTYNHEEFVVEHLESIKMIVEKYGGDYETSLLICDDCSEDDTVKKCRDWLKSNESLFASSRISINSFNVGIVKNYIKTIRCVETEDFKILAGDDAYSLFNIYRIFELNKNSILITHLYCFGGEDNSVKRNLDASFYLLYEMFKDNKLNKLLAIDNFIPAPAAFVPGKYLKNEELLTFLSNYRFIEDFPQWIYLVKKNKIRIIVEDAFYIKYRLGYGISSSSTHMLKKEFINETQYIGRQFGLKNYILPSVINPYKYWVKIKMKILYKKYFYKIEDNN